MQEGLFLLSFAELISLQPPGPAAQCRASLPEPGRGARPNASLHSALAVPSSESTIGLFPVVSDPSGSVTVFFQMFPSRVAITGKAQRELGQAKLACPRAEQHGFPDRRVTRCRRGGNREKPTP